MFSNLRHRNMPSRPPGVCLDEKAEAVGLARVGVSTRAIGRGMGVVGELSEGMRSLRQVPDQLSTVTSGRAAHAFNDDSGRPRSRTYSLVLKSH